MNTTQNRTIASRDIADQPIPPLGAASPVRSLSLDGLRGVAVLLVLLYHHNFLNSGWIGVDLFFVLSGYLITSILRRSRLDIFYWHSFWLKRFTRIIPPLLLVLLATAVLRFRLSWAQGIAYLFSLGDVLAYLRPKFEPLRPLWSLAIEEHFYIFWPFAVRLLPRKTLKLILLSLIILEPASRALATLFTRDWQFVYFLTPFRLDGLALGCLLSLGLETERNNDLLKKWSGVSIAIAVAAWLSFRLAFGHGFTRDNPTVVYNSSCYSLVAFVAFFLIGYLITHPKSLAASALSWKPLVFTGTISYGLYLYQVLIRETVTRTWHLTDHKALLVDTPIAFLAAWLSFSIVEKPIMCWGHGKVSRFRESQQTN